MNRPSSLGCFVFAGVLAVLAFLFIYPSVVLTNKRNSAEAELRRIRAEGKPVTALDLAVRRSPGSRNAADIYALSFRDISGPAAKDIRILRSFVLQQDPGADTLGPTRSILRRFEHTIANVDKASALPWCSFPVRWEDGIYVRPTHIHHLQDLSTLLAARAIVSASEGDMELAVHCIGTNLRLGYSVAGDPLLESVSVTRTSVTNSTIALHHMVRTGHISAEQARRLYDVLGRLDVTRDYIAALEGERAVGVTCFEQIGGGKHPNMDVEKAGFWHFQPEDLTCYLTNMRRLIEVAKCPYNEAQRDGLIQEPQIPHLCTRSSYLLPSFVSTLSALNVGVARVDGLRLCLALIALKDKLGVYPTDLSQLRARLGWDVPNDPFSGKDFVYRREGKGFILYSIGPDMKDDGGKEPPKDDMDKGDIVWRMER